MLKGVQKREKVKQIKSSEKERGEEKERRKRRQEGKLVPGGMKTMDVTKE